ncbi:hypothetical protein FM996_17490 [Methylosinus sporium]|uniref:Uncharacterized protein n=1 Tax=Methylosinus sporium TaxID=428 RepID=A0A549SL81_METSR|nr:hypothetical protein [Methylosinus sp. KRF6]TRL30371.1 hypothetical protein FM996_17490 [Methylosinus sporium]
MAAATPSAGEDYDKLGRDALVSLLRSVIEQRDDVLSKYEAMAFQVDESTHEIDDAQLEAKRNAQKAEGDARKAQEAEKRAADLQRLLDDERRAKATLAGDFARYRDKVTSTPVDEPWSQLWRAISQIARDAVAWARAKIPADSQFLPWFDKGVDFIVATGRLLREWSLALYDWARPRTLEFYAWGKPRAIDLWKRLKTEIERRMGPAKS